MPWRAWISGQNSQVLPNQSLVVFDTSSLLNLYSFPVKTTNKMLAVISRLSQGPLDPQVFQVYIPPQVVFEFVTSRKGVLEKAIKAYDDVIAKIHSVECLLDNEPDYIWSAIREDWLKESNAMCGRLASKLDKEKQAIRKRNDADPVLKNLAAHFDKTNRCAPTPDEVEWVEQQGAKRYKSLIPPGFADKIKATGGDQDPRSWYVYSSSGVRVQQQYGDLLVWHQALTHAKDLIDSGGFAPSTVVFVTDDVKPDWYHESTGGASIPHPLLRLEAKEAGVDLLLVGSDEFLAAASASLKMDVNLDDIALVRSTVETTRRGLEPALEAAKEVEKLDENYEEGLVLVNLLREVPIATATLPFNCKFARAPEVQAFCEYAPTEVRCFAGVSVGNMLNIHINRVHRGERLPCGEYIVRYVAKGGPVES